MDNPGKATPGAHPLRPEDDARIFEEDESGLDDSAEFDRAVAAAAAQMQTGDAPGARALLERALRLKPRNQRARNMLGLALFKLGETVKAESLYRGLIEDHPADPTLRVNLGLVFLKAGLSSDAVRCFETALDLSPDHAKAMNYLGLAYAQNGEHGRAREWFLRCGNGSMAERMAQAVEDSPLREVASEAALAIDSGLPFRSALDSTQEPQPTSDSAPESTRGAGETDPASMSTPPHGSRWVATTPASVSPAPSTSPDARPPQALAVALPPEPAAPAASTTLAASSPVPPTALAAYTNQKRLSVPSGEGRFVIGPAEVLIQVQGELLTRLDGLVASWGTATMKPELKRFRGKVTDKPFGEGARRMLRAVGEGRFVVARENRCFTALELDDEPAYFREEIIFAFEESLLFENGRVPGKSGTDLHLVHLRGRGRLLLVTVGTPRSVEVTRQEPLRIPMDQLIGWHGPLIQPRLVPIVEEAPELGTALELSGEGRALVDAPDGR